ncbi:hypothetical protein LB504_001064 [Fusarium proliferatum]|nr:hypothetical protein LB504_001064 [Fusarium proliferatum]
MVCRTAYNTSQRPYQFHLESQLLPKGHLIYRTENSISRSKYMQFYAVVAFADVRDEKQA